MPVPIIANPPEISSSTYPIAGLVASAGGLDAFKKFFSAMPGDSGLAFVLVPHLDPSHESMMVELLGKLTPMPVMEAKQGMAVLPNCIYIIPPNIFLSISGGLLQLNLPPAGHGWQTSIDYFLRSLADDQGERAIGIVLSGTGSHGSLGIREIKLAGGMVMAQKPETAEYDQMPLNAISTGVIDYVLPPEQMPAALLKYIQQPYLRQHSDEMALAEQASDLLNQILVILQSQAKYDFRPYRKPMVLRRIQRRMGIVQIDNLSHYLEFLKEKPEEITALYKDLLISVTAFFRDPDAYQILEKEVIPALLAQHNSSLPIRVWVAGCASGEEAYSIAMLWIEAIEIAKLSFAIQVFASDIDASAIDVARAGIYPASIAGDVSPKRLRAFFTMLDENHYQINKKLRESVVFSHQNLIGDAPFSKIDLISCRNLLIYLEPEMQKNVIALFHFALVAGGYLLLGPSETIGRSGELFETVSKKWRVFRRLESVKRDVINIPLRKSTEPYRVIASSSPSAPHRKSFKEITEQLILNEHAPAAALCNHSLEVLYVTGPLANFLEFPRGELTKDLLAMARPGLRTKLRAACRNAIQERKTIVTKDIRINRGGQYFKCSVIAKPLAEPKEVAGLLLVLFYESLPFWETEKSGSSASTWIGSESVQDDDSPLTQQLEMELKSMSEELRSTVEEMESSNEELKTSNEEIMSVNEELQSVNEELETSKEELQSLNEELSTVNGQLQEKVNELKQSTEDMTNLMSSTEIATIFLDEQLRIKLFTPPTKSLLNLLSTDVGRPLKDIAPKFADDSMIQECRDVLETEKALERELKTEDSKHFLRRILPYRSSDNFVSGVVITFIDLTQRKNSEAVQRETDARHFAELYEGAERLQAILNAAADAIITIDLQGKIESVNRATESLFQYQRDELIGKNIASLMPFLLAADQDQNREASATIADRLVGLLGDHCEVQAHRKDASTFPVDLVLSRVDHLRLYTGILRDITLRKQLQAQILEIATNEQSRIGQELHDGTQQELTGLTLFAGAINDFLDRATQKKDNESVEWRLQDLDFQRIKQALAKLTSGLIEANQHIHKLSHGIMPVQIDAEGLRSALAELAASTNATQKVNCSFDFHGAGTIRSNAVATQLYRIAQESLTNSLKHGKASNIQISLAQEADQTILEISDNGVGFDLQTIPGTASEGSGFGLRIMRYRANTIGGDLHVSRNNNNGTSVRCVIPTLGTIA
ncbi:chemotaxis protein CheB [Pirellulaceae bacterium SH467]